MWTQEGRFWLDLVQWAFTLGLALLVWLRKPGQDAANAVGQLRDFHGQRLENHLQRIIEIETHMEHMPSRDELRKLEGALQGIEQRTLGISDGMATMRVTLARIEDFLLKNRLR